MQLIMQLMQLHAIEESHITIKLANNLSNSTAYLPIYLCHDATMTSSGWVPKNPYGTMAKERSRALYSISFNARTFSAIRGIARIVDLCTVVVSCTLYVGDNRLWTEIMPEGRDNA